MFLVKRNVDLESPHSNYSESHRIVGSAEELARAHQYLTALALGIAMEDGSDEAQKRTLSLLTSYNPKNTTSLSFFQKDSQLLEGILCHLDDFMHIRQEQVITLGIQGKLGAVAVSQELRLTDDYDGGVLHIDNMLMMTEDGIAIEPTGANGLQVAARRIDELYAEGFYSDAEADIFAGLPATHSATQYELVEDKSGNFSCDLNKYHETAGNFEDGSFVSYATVLNR